jgi:hypothetical protein
MKNIVQPRPTDAVKATEHWRRAIFSVQDCAALAELHL